MFKSLSNSLIARGVLAIIVGGLVSIAFGVVLAARPGIGAVTLALLFGLYSMIFGVSQIAMGIEARQTGGTLHSALQDAA